MRVHSTFALVAVLLCSVSARAQMPDASAVPMKGTFTVYVLDSAGGETEGRLVSLTDAAVTIQTASAPRTFNLSDVVRIYRRGDSLKNGAMIGGGFGFAMGVLTGGFSDCPGADQSKGCPGSRVAIALASAATWAAIGTAIDALIPGRTLMWTRGASPSSTRGLILNVSPRTRSASIAWRIR